jgi:trehalose 6-phosphate phosphatase
MQIALPLPAPDSRWAFFLDVDGTLADIAPVPAAVAIADHARDTLSRLAAACDGAVALVSGRPIADVDGLFAPLHLPVAGLHGLERRDARGRVTRAGAAGAAGEDGDLLAEARDALTRFAAAHPGALIEDKGLTLALHYRQAPAAEGEARALMHGLRHGSGGALVLQHGKMVIELRPAGNDKGTAVAAFMAEAPFAGRLPVFVGDDVTDEAGFATINALSGISIRVGEGAPTCARYDGASVAEIHDWLAAAAAALEGSRAGPSGRQSGGDPADRPGPKGGARTEGS